jgi:hypothetical protein
MNEPFFNKRTPNTAQLFKKYNRFCLPFLSTFLRQLWFLWTYPALCRVFWKEEKCRATILTHRYLCNNNYTSFINMFCTRLVNENNNNKVLNKSTICNAINLKDNDPKTINSISYVMHSTSKKYDVIVNVQAIGSFVGLRTISCLTNTHCQIGKYFQLFKMFDY